MNKNIGLILVLVFLSGCIESMALLGPAATGAGSGQITKSAFSTAMSYGVKQQTGKTPSGHALAYVKKHNPENKKENCIGLKTTNSKACAIANKKVALAKKKVKKTVTNKTISFKKQFAQARKAGLNSFVFNNKIYNTTFKKTDVSEKKTKSKKLGIFNR
jgi:hypothetical protein